MILTEVYGPQIVPGTPSKHRPRHIPSNICPLPFFKFISPRQPTPKNNSCPFKYQRRSGGSDFPSTSLRPPGSAIFPACLTSFSLSPCTPEVNIPLYATLLWGLFFSKNSSSLLSASGWVSRKPSCIIPDARQPMQNNKKQNLQRWSRTWNNGEIEKNKPPLGHCLQAGRSGQGQL